MSSNSNYQSSFAPSTNISNLPTFGKFGSTLLERSNPGLRRSTPDSEVLASSDEELDQSRQRGLSSRQTLPSRRRSSLLSDQAFTDLRRNLTNQSSRGNISKASPTALSNQEAWSKMNPPAGWNQNESNLQAIWSSDARTSHDPSEQIRNALSSTTRPSSVATRSMSFSVGQSENDSTTRASPSSTTRSSLQRRTSNMGGEGMLRRVSENDEDVSGHTTTRSQPFNNHTLTRALSTVTRPHAAVLQSAIRHSVYHSPEMAIDDMDDPRPPISTSFSRRMSELPTNQLARQQTMPVGQTSTVSGRPSTHWSTGLGFDTQDMSASRRHSFADVPTRRGSLGSDDQYDTLKYATEQQTMVNNTDNDFLSQIPANLQTSYQNHTTPTKFGLEVPHNSVRYHEASPQLLHIVTFKCDRAGIFYIPEHVPLTVQEGDLVVVEADRGFDVGTVHETNLTPEEAEKAKNKHNAQQFEYLMMFSRHAQAQGVENCTSPATMATYRNTGTLPGSAVKDADLKPKQIYQHANGDHYTELQNKEGEEAKAKRMCASKAAHHGLHHMEILDAEFQADYKKLTFYYYSTTYVNFNILVTELFKNYKTRIWMSAINPASFQSPTSAIIPSAASAGPGITRHSQPSLMNMGSSNPALAYGSHVYGPNALSAASSTFPSPFVGGNGFSQVQPFLPAQAAMSFNPSSGHIRYEGGLLTNNDYQRNDSRDLGGRALPGSMSARFTQYELPADDRYGQTEINPRTYMTDTGHQAGRFSSAQVYPSPSANIDPTSLAQYLSNLDVNQHGPGGQMSRRGKDINLDSNARGNRGGR